MSYARTGMHGPCLRVLSHSANALTIKSVGSQGRCPILDSGMQRRDLITRKLRLHDPDDAAVLRLGAAERLRMVWPLTIQSWAFKTGNWNEPRLRRDVSRVIRGRR